VPLHDDEMVRGVPITGAELLTESPHESADVDGGLGGDDVAACHVTTTVAGELVEDAVLAVNE
jgi:hypothetical protein